DDAVEAVAEILRLVGRLLVDLAKALELLQLRAVFLQVGAVVDRLLPGALELVVALLRLSGLDLERRLQVARDRLGRVEPVLERVEERAHAGPPWSRVTLTSVRSVPVRRQGRSRFG